MSKISKLGLIFVSEFAVFSLIVTGLLPRSIVPYFVGALAVYVILASLEDATIFFVMSVPFFLAIPITANFDNFNAWRIISAIIFFKWALIQFSIFNFQFSIKSQFSNFKKTGPVLILLLLFAILSIIPASDKILAVKRVAYFLNLSLIGFVIFDLTQKKEFAVRLIKNIAVPTIIVAVVGFIQLCSTYLMDIYQFMGFWGGRVQFNQFGAGWSYIAYNLGNTWFAYYGQQISLRMFSLFPDSHSFPQFMLLGLPAVFAPSLYRLNFQSLKTAIKTRAKLFVLFIPLIFLAAILTGTRGIWAAGAGVLPVIALLIYLFKKHKTSQIHQNIFKYISSYVVVFFLLFSVAFPIFASPQFLLYKLDSSILTKRVGSIISFGETSNKERIRIWKLSFESIKNHPLLGVGIGNFPVVLNQDLALAKAGSSAHNLYLQIAAEMGIPALIFALWFLWLLMQKTYDNFVREHDQFSAIYFGSALIFIPWVLIYSLTDVAIFDERAFLMFAVTMALILGTKNPINGLF